jgi:hypothetical protein
MSHVIYIASDNVIRLSDLTDNVTGLPISNADVEAQILSDSTSMGSPLSFVADDTNGNYHAIVPWQITQYMVEDREYIIAVTAVDGQSQLYQELTAIGRVKQPSP